MKLFRKLWGNPNSLRKKVREAYFQFYTATKDRRINTDRSPHEVGLAYALKSRYDLDSVEFDPKDCAVELLPFIFMEETESLDAFVEYVVLKEYPNDARVDWLRERVASALELAEGNRLEIISALVKAKENGYPWRNLLPH